MNGLDEDYRLVKALSDTANGTVNGKEKITLETYVQAAYFERILDRANTRLLIMSDGQYELKRAESASNVKSKSGLDMNIVDHYNGTERGHSPVENHSLHPYLWHLDFQMRSSHLPEESRWIQCLLMRVLVALIRKH